MRNASTWIAGGMLCVALAGPAMAQNFLDDMIYSAKCSGANDKEACKVKARQDFEDHQQGKNGGIATSNVGSGTSAGGSATSKCQSATATGPANVDTAYIRAEKKFHFTTQEEMHSRQEFWGGLVSQRFRHAKTPGVMYDLWDNVDIPGYQGVRPTAGLTLSKSANGGTDMAVEYCLGNNDPAVSNQAFWDAADKAFRSLVM